MTLLQISERIRDHLTKQHARSSEHVDSNASCMYRGPAGTMCAVGCLITDEFYSADLEQKGAKEYVVIEAVANSLGVDLLGPRKPEVRDFLTTWQCYHDTTCDPEYFIKLDPPRLRQRFSYRDYLIAPKRNAAQSPEAFHNYLVERKVFDIITL